MKHPVARCVPSRSVAFVLVFSAGFSCCQAIAALEDETSSTSIRSKPAESATPACPKEKAKPTTGSPVESFFRSVLGPSTKAKKKQPVVPPATHQEVATIDILADGKPMAIHTLCLTRDGNILAACGGERTVYRATASGSKIETVKEEAGIRVMDPAGKLVATWPLQITPQSVNVGDDGTIYAAGQGRVVKLNAKGKVLLTADAPHVAQLGPLPEIPEEEAPSKKNAQNAEKEAKIAELGKKIEKARKVLIDASKSLRAARGDAKKQTEFMARYRKAIDDYIPLQEELRELTTSPQTLAVQARAAAMRKRAITGIAATGKDVFIACPATKGYGYDIWRVDDQLTHPKKIVTGLRGCCGQMDIQAYGGQVFAAENARGRVVCYDRDGKQLSYWGKNDRSAVDGFGSCCNPMNIRFGAHGDIYTAEASVGTVKRFSHEGKFLGIVGTVKVVPGCKHVAIGVSENGDRVYMLDITRHCIAVLEKQKSATVAASE